MGASYILLRWRIILTTTLLSISTGPVSSCLYFSRHIASSMKYMVVAVNRTDGSILWERVVREEIPHEKMRRETSWVASSAIVDGQRIYADFESRGLYCLSMNGDVIWEKDFGDKDIRSDFGEGATPALYRDRLVVNWDEEGPSFITALDAVA